jgi:hypothetical protein
MRFTIGRSGLAEIGKMSGSNPEFSSANIWLVRTLGQEFGPFSIEFLIRMAERGELLAWDEVRALDRPWMPADAIEELAPVLNEFQWGNLDAAPPGEASGSRPAPSTPSKPEFDAAAFLCSNEWAIKDAASDAAWQQDYGTSIAGRPDHQDTVADSVQAEDWQHATESSSEPAARRLPSIPLSLVAIGLCAGALLIASWRGPGESDQADYERIEEIWQQVQSLHESEATEEEWDAFAEESQRSLMPMVESLQRRASARAPTSQNLLWAARDYLLPLLNYGSQGNPRCEAKFHERMELAADLLSR